MTVDIDPVIHAPKRLEICAFLAVVPDTEFGVLRDALEVSDSVVSKHLRVLSEAGYVTLWRQNVLGRSKTWVALTPAGKTAYRRYVQELGKLLKVSPRG